MKTRRVGGKKKLKSAEPTVTLPEELSEKLTDLGQYSLLLYGDKKIGKTSFSAQAPDNFFMMCEPGGKSLEVYQRPVHDWREFRQYVKLLQKDTRFQTVTVDTADRAYEMCFDFMCKDMGIDHPGDENDFGKSWRVIKQEFAKQINLLLMSKGVILLSHAREVESKTKAGRKFTRLQPSMSGQPSEVLEAVVDLWVNYGYEGNRRVLTLRGDEYIAAGIRPTEKFLYTDGSQIRTLDVEGSAESAYATFVQAFNNELDPPVTAEPAKKKKRVKTLKGRR